MVERAPYEADGRETLTPCRAGTRPDPASPRLRGALAGRRTRATASRREPRRRARVVAVGCASGQGQEGPVHDRCDGDLLGQVQPAAEQVVASRASARRAHALARFPRTYAVEPLEVGLEREAPLLAVLLRDRPHEVPHLDLRPLVGRRERGRQRAVADRAARQLELVGEEVEVDVVGDRAPRAAARAARSARGPRARGTGSRPRSRAGARTRRRCCDGSWSRGSPRPG